ncbi:ABC transporter ATP-binding protein [Panacibacter ginsenosidivorans]|uniref:ABC transporter ATP-binding protein n=1 Tax=Panacibacter ginsenosidivorans TaxID=1813871 RepID=UPI001CEFA5DB|nr:ATP-binding cassette domain-containing protein [Panacibacter ginsenosidivorans]
MQSSSNTNPVHTLSKTDAITVSLQNAGKRFNREWIFRHVDYTFQSGNAYAITGPNGSGKSTLLQCIAASIQVNEGAIEFNNAQKKLEPENIYKYISIAAPYLEVIEEMTATEFLLFHTSFKPLLSTITIPEILEIIGLQAAANKQIRFYSSGMKQRTKLAQAIFSDVPILLLDEPCTNFDTAGYELYHRLINEFCKHKLIVVSSNDINEYNFCSEVIAITDYKIKK